MSKPLTGAEYMNLLEGPLNKQLEKEGQWSQDPGAFAQGGFISSGGQMVQSNAVHTACMATMEQPGMWLVENTKRKLIYCNAERGHPGNHRYLMEWANGPDPFMKQATMPSGFWGDSAWTDPPGDAYLAQKYGAYLDEAKKPLVDPKDIKVSFSTKEQGK